VPTVPLTSLFQPPRDRADDKPPLLVLLHGVGSNEHDLLGLAPHLDPRLAIVSARAPHTRAPGSYAWFEVQMLPGAEFRIQEDMWRQSLTLLVEFITAAAAEHGADPARVYLGGFSQGAIMSLCVMLTRPDLVAGVAAMSGRLLPEVRPLARPATDLSGFPVLVTHGTVDQVIPIRYGHEVRDYLQGLPVDLTYQEFAMGHEVTGESLGLVSRWLSTRLEFDQAGPRAAPG
jgi:phospholipase/carboxylesterase